MAIYQDLWANGKLVERGYRECENRYDIIKSFCETRLKHGFSVCDIGANMCYFGIRLAEDFGCNVIAFEFHNFMSRKAHLGCSGASNSISLLNHRMNLKDISILNKVAHFDLVLALSILHHVHEDQSEWEKNIATLGDYSIVEYAGSDSKRERANIDFDPNDKGDVIGYGDSHLDNNKKRPIVVLRKDI
jgi:hypothetical protein